MPNNLFLDLQHTQPQTPKMPLKRHALNTTFVIASIGLLTYLLPACNKNINPTKPKIDTTAQIPPIQPSFINIPIQINLSPLVAELEKNVPQEIKANETWTCEGNDCVKYYVKRDKLAINVKENNVQILTLLSYWLQYSRKVPNLLVSGTSAYPVLGECGLKEDLRQLSLGINMAFDWNENWSLQAKSTAMPITSIKNCKVTLLKYNATPLIVKKFEDVIGTNLNDLDKQIPQLSNMEKQAANIWKQMQQPIAMSPELWFAFNPQTLAVSPISGKGLNINFVICLAALPKVIDDDKKPALTQQKLPKLTIKTQKQTGFRVELDGEISYDKATKIAQQNLQNYSYAFGGKQITIANINVKGIGKMVLIETKIKGDLNGTLYFTGKPYYNNQTKTIRFKDFDYSIDTKQKLTKIADELLHNSFKNIIEKQLVYPVGDQIAAAEKNLNTLLNQKIEPNIKLSGKITQLNPIGVYNTENSFKAIVLAEGEIAAKIN